MKSTRLEWPILYFLLGDTRSCNFINSTILGPTGEKKHFDVAGSVLAPQANALSLYPCGLSGFFTMANEALILCSSGQLTNTNIACISH